MTRAKAPHVGAAHTPAIPLDIVSLLVPYRRHGRLALRIEQMPQNSRMSRGRNNGDRSWSLAEHELNDLSYHLPQGPIDDHALMVRVVGLDQDGATLGVLSVPITVAKNSPQVAANDIDRLSDHRAAIAIAEKRAAERLEEARAQWQSEAGENLAQAEAALRAQSDARFAEAEARWKQELEHAKADAAAIAGKVSAAPPGHAPAKLDPQTLAKLRSALASLTEDLASRDAALSETRAQIAKQDAERQELRSELARVKSDADAKPGAYELEKVQSALVAAETNLADRDADLAGALAQIARQQTEFTQLRDELKRAQTDATDKNASNKTANDQTAKLQSALKSAEAHLAARETDLAEMRAQLARQHTETNKLLDELKRAQSDAAEKPGTDDLKRVQDALDSAKADAVQRDAALAAARAQIARHEIDVAELRAALESSQAVAAAKPDADELLRVKGELTAIKAGFETRGGDLADARAAIAKHQSENEQLRTELVAAQSAIAEKDAAFAAQAKRQQADQLAAEIANAGNETTSAAQIDQLRSELAAAQTASVSKDSAFAEQSERLRGELSAAKAALLRIDSEMVELKKNSAQSEDRWRRQSIDALAKAKGEWEKSSAKALAKAETTAREWQSQCNDLESQLRSSEAVLADIRRRSAKGDTPHDESADVADLREQLCALQLKFAEREGELEDLRTMPAGNRRLVEEDHIVLRTNRMIGAADEELPTTKKAREFAVSMVVFAIVTILGILYMPRLESFLPYGWQYGIDSSIADLRTSLGMDAPVVVAATPAATAPAKTAAVPQAIVIRTAKLHAGPKASESVSATLQRDAEVDVLEHSGNWTRVRSTNK
ncbi:MAG TPA: hypothetical protein VG309_02355, partial [Rhizomicrobium sp.]|nr:hypothetical protein [Rhizomicrobium sp.]